MSRNGIESGIGFLNAPPCLATVAAMAKLRFGIALRRMRRKSKKSLRQLAQALGVSTPYLSVVEHGYRGPLRPDRIASAAKFLGGDPTELFRLAALEWGAFRLPVRGIGSKANEVGAILMREWDRLTDSQLDRILGVLEAGSVG